MLEIQLKGGLKDLTPEEVSNLVIAYEPVWAIGTGLTATSKEAQEAHSFIRKVISDVFGADAAAKVRIQYGGSVNRKTWRNSWPSRTLTGLWLAALP